MPHEAGTYEMKKAPVAPPRQLPRGLQFLSEGLDFAKRDVPVV